jgi:hypothetical protein
MSQDVFWFSFIGAMLGMVGSVLLGYDVVFGAGKRFQAKMTEFKLANLKQTRMLLQRVIKNVPSPPYKPGEIQLELDKEEAQWGPKERQLQEENDKMMGRHEDKVVILGFVGMLMLAAGFILQGIALIKQFL